VEIACEDHLIAELRLHLRGTIVTRPRLADLLASAPAAAGGCSSGRIDPAGLSH
jgi:hypothetical protein